MNSRKEIPHGTYTMDQSWSSDTDTKYYKGWKMKVMWPLIKCSILLLMIIFLNMLELTSLQIFIVVAIF